jgi:hypothetical protein
MVTALPDNEKQTPLSLPAKLSASQAIVLEIVVEDAEGDPTNPIVVTFTLLLKSVSGSVNFVH